MLYPYYIINNSIANVWEMSFHRPFNGYGNFLEMLMASINGIKLHEQ